MQLVAYGAQDVYLTGQPQVTFFKVVYRRHTNFSMESIEQTINGNVGAGSRVTSTISRNGDLVYRLFYEIKATPVMPASTPLANTGAGVFDNIEIEIGGQRIDRQTGQWLHTWASLTEENSARLVSGSAGTAGSANPDQLTQGGTLFQELTAMGGTIKTSDTGDTTPLDIKVPLQFWFCRNPGLALPLIALQYHEVKVVTTFSSLMTSAAEDYAKLWADYIYLDTDERRRFAQVSHEYLIEQVQFQAGGAVNTSTELNFNHPVKELVWTGGWGSGVQPELEPGNYQLKLNGHDRMSERPLNYFTKQQVWMHHTGPGSIGTTVGVGGSSDAIAVYSFALKPEEHQPSGTCNFSRIDNAQLVGPSDSRDVFAVNYNVLRIMSGMGGLAYSN